MGHMRTRFVLAVVVMPLAFATSTVNAVESDRDDVKGAENQSSTLDTKAMPMISDPNEVEMDGGGVEEAVNQCYLAAFEAKSAVTVFRWPKQGVIDQTCAGGTRLDRDRRSVISVYTAPDNYMLVSYEFRPTSKTSGGYFQGPALVQGGRAVRVVVGCRGNKGIGVAREWSKGYLRGTVKYVPTDLEQREILAECLAQNETTRQPGDKQ